ncbi:hypothetical protein ACFFX0_02255 [Citricoccus parietis]|uniref:Uncharacterized protein n=1 Tax=Citricoccus parietis TaxID=592307 RepID=A0ABV5FTX0_9MICC
MIEVPRPDGQEEHLSGPATHASRGRYGQQPGDGQFRHARAVGPGTGRARQGAGDESIEGPRPREVQNAHARQGRGHDSSSPVALFTFHAVPCHGSTPSGSSGGTGATRSWCRRVRNQG